jgi:hypothetical protein
MAGIVPASLESLQRVFRDFVVYGSGPLASQVVESESVPAGERLAIYSLAYRLRLCEALELDFPGLKGLLGSSGFSTMGRAYVDAHPSRHPSIRWFGAHLAGFLGTEAPYRETPALAEMAAFEWAISLAFDAADAGAVALADVAALPADAWPALRLVFHPSVQRLDLRWNVAALRRAVERDEAPGRCEAADVPVAWIVWRKNLMSHYRSMAVDEAVSLDAAVGGASFAELCEGLCEWMDAQHVALHAAGLLKGWVTEQMLVGLESTGTGAQA